MSDPAGNYIHNFWAQQTQQPQPKTPTIEELRAQLQAAQMQQQIQEAKLAEERARSAEFDRKLKEGPQLTYNPIEETVGPDGKKTIGLRKEFQLEGPEKFIEAERARLGTEQAGAMDTLQQQIAQQQAQQRAQMASRGGMRGGNQALMSRFSMRDALMGRQQLGREGARQRGELEAKGYSLKGAIAEKNLTNLLGSVKDVETFNLDKWKKQKEVEASKIEADATRQAGQGK